jgi:hypothetical protein
MISIGKTLAMIAAGGILLGACGGSDPQAAAPSASDPSAAGAKASCSGAGHTDDKSHCAAKSGDAGASQ